MVVERAWNLVETRVHRKAEQMGKLKGEMKVGLKENSMEMKDLKLGYREVEKTVERMEGVAAVWMDC